MVPLSSSTPVKRNVVDATPKKTTIRVDSALLQKNKSPKTVVISKKGKSNPPPVYKAIQKQDMEKVKGFFQGHKVKRVSTATASGDPLFFQIVTVDEGQSTESELQGSETSAHDQNLLQQLVSHNDEADKLPDSVVIKQEPDTNATTPEQPPDIDYSSLLLKPGAAEAIAKALRNLSKHVSAIYISMHSSTSFEITLVKMLSL